MNPPAMHQASPEFVLGTDRLGRCVLSRIMHGAQYALAISAARIVVGTTRYMADDIAVMYLGQIVEYPASENLFENPGHPYSRALLSADLPSHPDESKEEPVLSGEIPSPLNPPSGCRFNPRCPVKTGPICETTPPVLRDAGPPHQSVACHLFSR